MIKKLNKNAMWIFCLLFSPLANFAQETTSASIGSNFSNALFNTLFFIIIILLIVLIVLGNALKNIVQGDYMQNKFKKNDEAKTNDNITKTTSVFLLLFTAFNCAAQSATPSQSQDWLIGGLDMFTVYFMLFIILIELIIIVIFSC